MGNYLSFLNEDLCSCVTSNLDDIEVYMLSLVSKELKANIKFNYRIRKMIMKLAIKNKSLSCIRFVEELIGKKVNIQKHFINIISTNDMELISTFIDINVHDELIKCTHNTIVKKCDTNISMHLLKKYLHIWVKDAYRLDKLDFDKIPVSQHDIVLSHISQVSLPYTKCLKDLNFIKYLHSRDHRIKLNDICKDTFVTNLEYAQWITKNLNFMPYEIHTIITNATKKISNFVIIWLYTSKYFNICNIYEYAYCSNNLHLLRPEDNKPITTPKTVLYDISNNIFDMNNIKMYITSRDIYYLLYFVVKYDRFNIYSGYIFSRLNEINRINNMNNINNIYYLIRLSKYTTLDQFLEYGPMLDFKKFVNYPPCLDMFIEYRHNVIVSEILVNTFSVDSIKLMKLYKKNLVDVVHYYLDNPKNIIISNSNQISVNVEQISHICKTGNIRMLKFISDKRNRIDYHYIFKICKLSVILQVGLFEKERESVYENINYALRYGDNEIVDYVINVLGTEMFTETSICCAYLNSRRLAETIIEKKYNGIIDLHICVPLKKLSSKLLKEYCDWILLLDFVKNEFALKKILETRNHFIIEIFFKKYDMVLGVDLVNCILELNDVNILKYAVDCVPMNFTTENIMFMIKNNLLSNLIYLENINKISYSSNFTDNF